MTLPITSIRCTHSGQYADGRPNTSSIFIADLDVGAEYQTRKSPCYIPFGGYLDVPVTTRSVFSLEKGSIAKFIESGLITAEYINGTSSEGVQPIFSWGTSSGGPSPFFSSSENTVITRSLQGDYNINITFTAEDLLITAGLMLLVSCDGGYATLGSLFLPHLPQKNKAPNANQPFTNFDDIKKHLLSRGEPESEFNLDINIKTLQLTSPTLASEPGSLSTGPIIVQDDIPFSLLILRLTFPVQESPQAFKAFASFDNFMSKNMTLEVSSPGTYSGVAPGCVLTSDYNANAYPFISIYNNDEQFNLARVDSGEQDYGTFSVLDQSLNKNYDTDGAVAIMSLLNPVGSGPVVAHGFVAGPDVYPARGCSISTIMLTAPSGQTQGNLGIEPAFITRITVPGANFQNDSSKTHSIMASVNVGYWRVAQVLDDGETVDIVTYSNDGVLSFHPFSFMVLTNKVTK